MTYALTHTRARKITDGARHVTQMHEFFALMGWIPAPAPVHPDKLWRGSKFAEEREELRRALAAEDPVEIADALGDMAYVVVATMLNYGVAASLNHFSWTDPNGTDREVTAAISAITCSKATEQPCAMECTSTHLDESVRRLSGVGDNPYAARWHGLHALTGINAMAVMTLTPMVEVFTEVHRSNMSKLRGRHGEPVKGPGYRPPVLGPILKEALL